MKTETAALMAPPTAREKVNNTIVISGTARSGTTLLGKLLHSFVEVEYQFEPPQLFALLPLIEQLPEAQWRLLYETYLYEDFFVNALAGRRLNCNRVDDSGIYRVKPHQEIDARLQASLTKAEVEQRQQQHRIAYKIPDMLLPLATLQTYYPGTRIIVIEREPSAVIKSVLAKGWFSNASLRQGQLIWPNRPCHHQGQTVYLPFWLPQEKAAEWLAYGEADRAAYYYWQLTRQGRQLHNTLPLQYADLVARPTEVVQGLAQALGLTPGEKTAEIIAEVFPEKPVDAALLNNLAPTLQHALQALYPQP